ncbi:pyridine nucleotide-disulfide oxidoreductase [Acidiferrobacter sp. SPIII_3]|jgi:NADPH-dependent glutamate synthase beta subunit-like oxidoreductase/NAD(P)H-flavin reductase|uniref:FAD-dependent oxidoreductase n=1 Tax=Acidiferrobacter sp. SPIII_3 TaxID=1281578 RepID=UPI000D728B60|nr:FAD-dependent oxidoreductase [Acidiferrobacter sp. SPIII_3]AWP22097.1 pyridine nucleotide-disulfide oxidoreductase [Acidiferrobacter sp. SPIII_3]
MDEIRAVRRESDTGLSAPLELADGYDYADIRSDSGLLRLDDDFLKYLGARDADLKSRLREWRSGLGDWSLPVQSTLRLAIARHFEGFVARLFGIEAEVEALAAQTRSHDVIMAFKKEFVLRRARRYRGEEGLEFGELKAWLKTVLAKEGFATKDQEWATARLGMGWLVDETRWAEEIARLTRLCALCLTEPDAADMVSGWQSFRLPQHIDPSRLVPLNHVMTNDGLLVQRAPDSTLRRRDGFHLTDTRMDARAVQAEVHYCLYCHDHEGDFCSKGFPEKKGVPGDAFKVDAFGGVLAGCPLGEKISEMQLLKRDGLGVAALAMAMVDNPMIPATGHRICNDCVKSCVYQKQDAVNIPAVETSVLTDVLNLPWGVEIYDLFTRWNPLRDQGYLPKPYKGRKVLVAGLGPAGFTMAHYLTQEGCAVVAIDGLKIEPLAATLIEGPVRDFQAMQEDLDERVLLGFGGVAEYGITVRWDKNFLKLIYVSLARRERFQLFGGVRLGGTMTLDDAWAFGFDHVCIATGAGLPRTVAMGEGLARGIRQASDFLMALQLTGAGKKTSLANLQLRLPAVVIGGGLTAVDTATEVQAYYVRQVEKVYARHEAMKVGGCGEKLEAGLGLEDRQIRDEFLEHGRLIREERLRAAKAGEAPDFAPLLRSFGGVTLVYRKAMTESPAYTRNHEELIKAMQEGLSYAECLEPLRAETDGYGHVKSMIFKRMGAPTDESGQDCPEVSLPARAVFIAAGTVPNTIYEREYPGTFALDGTHFKTHVAGADGLREVPVSAHIKAPNPGPFTSYTKGSRRVSFIGDTHPVFHGSVVKAIASAKFAYPQVMAVMEGQVPRKDDLATFQEGLAQALTARVQAVDCSRPGVVELWVQAPLAARNFRPGQFFRLQTFEATSPIERDTRLQIPVLTVSGAGVVGDAIRLLVLQWGTGQRLVGRLKPGDPLVLMGPTGAPTDIPKGQTILVIAGRWGAAVMLDIGPALRAAGNRVLYVAALSRANELDYQDELEAAADQIIWCTGSGSRILARRPQDCAESASDMVALLKAYGDGAVGPKDGSGIALSAVDRLMVMGSTSLLKAFQRALKGDLTHYFAPNIEVTATVGSPMQCMMKGVCAQCLQWHIDPDTGQRTKAVFSCAGQDQPLACVDLDHLTARQTQNRLLDQISSQWLDHIRQQNHG